MLRMVMTSFVFAFAGLLSALAGTSVHRVGDTWGVALAIGLVFAGSVFARVTANWIGLAAYAAGLFVLLALFAGPGPGGSVVIADDAVGYAWMLGSAAAALLPAALPRKWIVATPRHAAPADEPVQPPTSL